MHDLRTSRILLAGFLAVAATHPGHATGWLTGPSSYQQAVQAMAASRWQEADSLIRAASPDQGRVEWVKRLLLERAESEEGSGHAAFAADGKREHLRPSQAVGHCYAHHNLYLFLRSEGIQGELLDDAFDRAEKTYRLWHLVFGKQLPESIRWPYAGLLYEVDRVADVRTLLEGTRVEEALPHGVEGPGLDEVERFQMGFQMLLAYFHTARGDQVTALGYLRSARRKGGPSLVEWMRESDDFWKMRNNPEFQALLRAEDDGSGGARAP